jgi:hypothetical protein
VLLALLYLVGKEPLERSGSYPTRKAILGHDNHQRVLALIEVDLIFDTKFSCEIVYLIQSILQPACRYRCVSLAEL